MPKTTPIWIVIPTYWGSAITALYDHPTPLDGRSTLPRLLDSIAAQFDPPEFNVLVLVAAVTPRDGDAARERALQVLSPFHDLNLALADARTAEWIMGSRPMNALAAFAQHAPMTGYGNVRNMQLLIPASLGAEIIIALDDDEVIPPDFIARALNWIGKKHAGQTITGIGGPYLDSTGSPYLPEVEDGANPFAAKSPLKNRGMQELLAKPDPPVETPMVFGGDMIFHRQLFAQVCFDPAIPRGEDIDYLINARIAGRMFFFDPDLTITHLPPRQFESPEYGRMKQDLIRFSYEREKLLRAGLSPSDFLPYPGCLLEGEAIDLALEALRSIGSMAMAARFGTPEEIAIEAREYTEHHLPHYYKLAELWPGVLEESRRADSFRQGLWRMCTEF